MKTDALGYYSVLGVSVDADISTIKTAYRDLAKVWHPDYNTSPEAVEKFQHLSTAWEVLSNSDSRFCYDALSLIYNETNFPPMESIIPYKEGFPNIRGIVAKQVKGNFITSKQSTISDACDMSSASRLLFKVSNNNWLLGWWSLQGFFQNLQAIVNNFRHPISSSESLRILIHNIVAYTRLHQPQNAVISAILALQYADSQTRNFLQTFIQQQNIKVSRPQQWNLWLLRMVQLLVPFIIVLAFSIGCGSAYVNDAELWSWLSKKSEINYYQEVHFSNKGRSVDDVVVGKVMSIPVDKADVSKLYHLISESKVMYGPSKDFDVLTTLSKGATIRLTGITPDKIWARIMIDNGEMGFVLFKVLKQGIGLEIPYGSKIFEK